MEEAVVAHVRGAEPPADIAARHGIDEATLDDWVNTFFDGGRAALKRLR